MIYDSVIVGFELYINGVMLCQLQKFLCFCSFVCLLKMDSDTVVQASPVASACSMLQLQACLSMPDTQFLHIYVYMCTHTYISHVHMFTLCPCAYVPQYIHWVRGQLSGIAGVGSPSTAWDPGIKLKALGSVTTPLSCEPSPWPSMQKIKICFCQGTAIHAYSCRS